MLYQEIQLQIPFWYMISNLFNFFESLKIILITMVTILMTLAKMATLGLLEIKVFSNIGHDVIISVHEITNKSFSRDLNYIVDVVM